MDLGGGPGRYAFRLQEKGHRVILADLAENNLQFARAKARALGLELEAYVKADARDLSGFPDESVEAVLALGPLYHLTEAGDRRRAIAECLRVLEPGGLMALAFLSVYAPLYDAVVPHPELLPEWRERIEDGYLRDGIHRPRLENPTFTDAWLVEPSQIDALLAPYPVDKLLLIGTEGMTAQSKYALCELPTDLLQVWVDFTVKTAHLPAALFGSEHLVYFGRKRTASS